MALVTARHISHDPVSNLKIKVQLKRITSTTVLGNIAETFANPTSTGEIYCTITLTKDVINYDPNYLLNSKIYKHNG